jgi:hypothetical protein
VYSMKDSSAVLVFIGYPCEAICEIWNLACGESGEQIRAPIKANCADP